jgi:peptide deformylase
VLLSKKEFLICGLYSAVIAIGILAIAGFYKNHRNVMPILEHPEPALRQIAEPIASIDASIISLTDDIVSTLRYKAVVDFFLDRSVPRGLAAPQVGIAKRLVVCGMKGKIKVMINPEILERKGIYYDYDDCMSVQEKNKTVIKRSAYVKVKYRTLENKEEILVVKNDYAALVEHEIDHLNGVLNIDYIPE